MRRTLLLALLLSGAATTAQAQDLLIRGGKIYTGAEAAPTAEAVLVRDGRIVWVGAERDQPAVPTTVPTIDLKGAALFPGFTDGHAHLDGIGWPLSSLRISPPDGATVAASIPAA